MKICALTKNNQISQHRYEHVHMEVIVFCSGQIFGEERHILVHQKRKEKGLHELDENMARDRVIQEKLSQLNSSVVAPFSI